MLSTILIVIGVVGLIIYSLGARHINDKLDRSSHAYEKWRDILLMTAGAGALAIIYGVLIILAGAVGAIPFGMMFFYFLRP